MVFAACVDPLHVFLDGCAYVDLLHAFVYCHTYAYTCGSSVSLFRVNKTPVRIRDRKSDFTHTQKNHLVIEKSKNS